MTRDEIDEILTDIFCDLFDVPKSKIDRTLSPDTLETWDSLAHLKLVAAIEEAFSIPLSPEDQSDMLSFELVGDIVTEQLKLA